MRELNYLQTRSAARYDDNDPERERNKNTTFADFIIDGKSLYQMLKKYGMVPSLGWGSIENQKQMIDYFLLKQLHSYLFYRYPILVCPWCGEEDCGFISVWIEREEDLVIWRDFKLEPSNSSIAIGPFYFNWKDYQRAIMDTLTIH